uniref:Protein RALF-like 34 n=1 Tax=Rhizophora mucronata TaxID=61149 RepID=A0A2P2Q6K0_RHIMU
MAASSTFQRFCLICFFFISFVVVNTPRISAQTDETAGLKIFTDALEWPFPMAMYSGLNGDYEVDDSDSESDSEGGLIDLDGNEGDGKGRRSLYWRRFHYYISYGALSANRIPCPPRSGRSYYTRNCFRSRTRANPYTRSCSRISRCRR